MYHLLSALQQPHGLDTIIVSVLQIRERRHREVEEIHSESS